MRMRIFLDGNDPQNNPPPEIEIWRPWQGEVVTSDIVAEGTVTDDEQLVYARYRLNEGDWHDLVNPVLWNVDLSLADMVGGDNTLTISASDGEGESTQTVTFIVDPEALTNEVPTVSISAPTENEEVGMIIKVLGTAYDDKSVSMVLVRVGDGKWSLAQGTDEWSTSLVVPSTEAHGLVTIEAKAWDGTVFSQVDVVNVTIPYNGPSSNDRPEIVIEHPAEGDVILSGAYISGRTEDDSDVVTTLMAIDGGPMESLTTETSWNRELPELLPGVHSITIIASDGLLTSELVTVNFTLVDYSHLRVVITSPENGTHVVDDILVSGVILYGHGDLSRVEIRLDDDEWSEVGNNRSWHAWLSLIDQTVGEHRIEVRASDSFGTPDVANVTVVLEAGNENPTEPKEPDTIYIWIILVVVVVFVIALWQAKRERST